MSGSVWEGRETTADNARDVSTRIVLDIVLCNDNKQIASDQHAS